MLVVPQEERKHTFKGQGYVKDFDNMTFMIEVPLRHRVLELFNKNVRW